MKTYENIWKIARKTLHISNSLTFQFFFSGEKPLKNSPSPWALEFIDCLKFCWGKCTEKHAIFPSYSPFSIICPSIFHSPWYFHHFSAGFFFASRHPFLALHPLRCWNKRRRQFPWPFRGAAQRVPESRTWELVRAKRTICGAPVNTIAFSWGSHNSNVTNWFMVPINYSIHGVYKPSYNWGGPTLQGMDGLLGVAGMITIWLWLT